MVDKPLTLLMERAAGWPENMQAELVEAMIEIEKKHGGVYRLSEEERAAIEESLEEVRRGEFATDEEVAALFKRYRG
jgi:predicted transcriptional regulator